MRLTEVACKDEGCKNYISSERVVAMLECDLRQIPQRPSLELGGQDRTDSTYLESWRPNNDE